MKAIQCGYPPHHHNGFVVTSRQWKASGEVTGCPYLEFPHKATVVMRRIGALDYLHNVTIYMYIYRCKVKAKTTKILKCIKTLFTVKT